MWPIKTHPSRDNVEPIMVRCRMVPEFPVCRVVSKYITHYANSDILVRSPSRSPFALEIQVQVDARARNKLISNTNDRYKNTTTPEAASTAAAASKLLMAAPLEPPCSFCRPHCPAPSASSPTLNRRTGQPATAAVPKRRHSTTASL